jgi:ankyrin repeat protein
VASRLDDGDDVEQAGTFLGRTALTYAALRGHAVVADVLLRQGRANPNARDSRGYTPLFLAARAGHAAVLRVLLEHNRTEVNLVSSNKCTLSFNAFWDLPVHIYGFTPLTIAIAEGHPAAAKVLIVLGHADPDVWTTGGMTALMWGAAHGDIDTITLLLERANADVHALSDSGNNALSWALLAKHFALATLLVLHGAGVHCPHPALHPPSSGPSRTALRRGLDLRDQVAQHRRNRRAIVLGWLQDQGLLANVALEVLTATGELAVSKVLLELGVML